MEGGTVGERLKGEEGVGRRKRRGEERKEERTEGKGWWERRAGDGRK